MRSFLTFVLAGSASLAAAQLTVTDSLTIGSVTQLLEGLNVSILNVEVNCPEQAMGHFVGTSELAISEGLVLTTGSADQLAGGAASFASAYLGTPGDADLDLEVVTVPTYDACVLEFDCIPMGDTLLFNFSFGSEEYPEFAGSTFNDVFAIYLTGPGFPMPTNVAALPNGTPVAINNVNGMLNVEYFHDNETIGGAYVAYDGFTTNLTAFAVVEPDAEYHFKIAIADVGDGVFDSGVFLEAFSFRSVSLLTTGVDEQVPRLRTITDGDQLVVLVPDAAVGELIELVDMRGSVIERVTVQSQRVPVDLTGLPAGVYIARIPQHPALVPVRLVKE
ncbi:MAG: T9SS type A sorting domain-containing protein [Flavobacteriales bacterium]|nr:T9SS type A sorting domain-containing protein [Flavobacteriales bacterium]